MLRGWRSGDELRDLAWPHRLRGAIEERDPDSGLLHAAREAWNALAVLELMLREKESEVREAMARNGLAAGQVNGGAVRARISEQVEGDEDD